MADKFIDELPLATDVGYTDFLVIEQVDGTKRLPVGNLPPPSQVDLTGVYRRILLGMFIRDDSGTFQKSDFLAQEWMVGHDVQDCEFDFELIGAGGAAEVVANNTTPGQGGSGGGVTRKIGVLWSDIPDILNVTIPAGVTAGDGGMCQLANGSFDLRASGGIGPRTNDSDKLIAHFQAGAQESGFAYRGLNIPRDAISGKDGPGAGGGTTTTLGGVGRANGSTLVSLYGQGGMANGSGQKPGGGAGVAISPVPARTSGAGRIYIGAFKWTRIR